jgi:Domain of unknown function (DUF6456)
MPRKRQPYLSVVSDRTTTEKPFNSRLGTRVVVDPYDGKPIEVTASLRDDPLARLHTRKQLAPHLHAAGLEMQRTFEAAEIAGVRGMDFSREPVDCSGGHREPYSDRHRRAADKLANARGRLSREDFAILKLVLGERLFISQVAAHRGWSDKEASLKFKNALSQLAELWGFSGQAPPRQTARDKYSKMALAA